jgi:predicted dehydrogenase
MSALRVGLIGAGGYGRVHVEGFLALQERGLVQITALADPSPAILKALGEIPALDGARRFLDYRELLAAGNLDAVVISAPISHHEEITLTALERDLYILLEKPPVPLLSQLERLSHADVHGRVMVGFQHVYSNLVQNLKQDLVRGRIGQLQSVAAHGLWPRSTSYYERSFWAGQLAWRGRPVLDGPCTNGMAHFVNLALYLAGEHQGTFASPGQLAGELYRARPELATYDTGCLSGNFDNGVRCFFGFSHASDQHMLVQLRLTGTDSSVLLTDDCETLRYDDGEVVFGDCGRNEMRVAFVDFANGNSTRNKTPLHATSDYLLATNMMMQSAGGIHTIPQSYIQPIDIGTDDGIYSIENLGAYFARAAEGQTSLREILVPWAQRIAPLSAGEFSEDELARIYGLSSSAAKAELELVPESAARA